MIKMMTGAACALMILAAGASASAQDDNDDYTFTVSNSSDMAIVTFHLAAQNDPDWSEDLIPDRIIAAGDTLDMEFSAAEDECEYATSVVMEDGTEHAALVDYCGITGIDISDDEGITYY